MAMQNSSFSGGWRCRVLVFCILVVLNASASTGSRLLDVSVSREQVKAYFIENGLGQTPPMG
ncbi:putative alpha-galactosidase-like [Sesbania bispinosa]|nr:putative alpha-galactosidase-like [Sesbania bispinosa]